MSVSAIKNFTTGDSVFRLQVIAPLNADELFRRVSFFDDQEAFAKLFYLLYKPLLRTSLMIVDSYETAEECVNDVLINLWKNRKLIKIENSVRAYALISVRNRSLDYLRKRNRARTTTLEEAYNMSQQDDCPEHQLHMENLHVQLYQAIEKLPPQCKNVFLMNRKDGLKYREIAEQLNISLKTVETHMGRALKFLRKQLIQWKANPPVTFGDSGFVYH